MSKFSIHGIILMIENWSDWLTYCKAVLCPE